ncbi:hypothetical protein B1R47_25215 [Salmonella enterica subsp. enterica serovar Weltevreden]|nr:hypothetical protein [Salmonella enterica subsp. enterica]EAB7627202.1 hypothetical protein [Salmonella enterica subsp. enterica serovar Weltevreden]EAW0935983.1 hypothetical protein [Salmonella enterica]ECE0326767.1 hypothetical protein [Salmonella enterica subsp. houtenae]ECE0559518.1 hypothetical protein [Salmonella enterica subsp. enterica serovar Richmond]ECU3289088.1 hypothetical protein [Salmonella enterica subsp. houtenae serovar Houten]
MFKLFVPNGILELIYDPIWQGKDQPRSLSKRFKVGTNGAYTRKTIKLSVHYFYVVTIRKVAHLE